MARLRLIVSDVDGTLVTPEKRLTPASVAGVRDLRSHGILFTVASSRPAFGLRALCEALELNLPIGPFNGSSIVNPDMSVIEQSTVPRAAVDHAVALFAQHGVDAWLFTNEQW